ncbi:hypothetical protein K504DRAFT_459769 [Pleomassaria siparia CBS 279.74]|uniref:Inner centromere protein ARK-binding domain-containing protein n=1 Tax=Pleomassaria siparia CBS 279.74 TaxID=1314801 RepID=A0A6G1K252_9PLEO|nr:hypothetical protein K504DRAFT_459769 [Pleomassaria siparia CBS 279.74]
MPITLNSRRQLPTTEFTNPPTRQPRPPHPVDMAATRSRAPAIGSADWILDERRQASDLVTQELEDFGFSVRNELEWLNEHMVDIFAQNGQNNLDVFKTPGKLRGKTPHTARKRVIAEPRQPLGAIFVGQSQPRLSPAQQSLKNTLQMNITKPKFNIAEDARSTSPMESPAVPSPVSLPLFSQTLGTGKGNEHSTSEASDMDAPGPSTHTEQWSPVQSTQDSRPNTQESSQMFSQQPTQSTQPTQPTQSFTHSFHMPGDERRDTGESFVSAKEEMVTKNALKGNLRDPYSDNGMDIDSNTRDFTETVTHGTSIRSDTSSFNEGNTAIHYDLVKFPEPPRVVSEQYSISAETHDVLDIADRRAHAPEPKSLVSASPQFSISAETQDAMDVVAERDETTVSHNVDEDEMDIDDDVRSPSDKSSPVKPLVRKSSLTFASLPAREPFLPKKSMGNRVSRTSYVDQNKNRNSQMGRFTGGKSLGGSQMAQPAETHDDDDFVDEDRPQLLREESETTKIHNKTSTQRLADRINMLKQKHEPPKSINHHIAPAQSSQPLNVAPAQPIETAQPSYPLLPPGKSDAIDEDDDDDWISPIGPAAAAARNPLRPAFSQSCSADTFPTPKERAFPRALSVSNPDISAVVESISPVGSPTSKKYMDGPLSASKAKFYSALRAAKEKIIGSSATSAQVKLDALIEDPLHPKLQAHDSSDDMLSPKHNDKPANGLFSHLRSPSKESVKSNKVTKPKTAAMPGSPAKEDGRRTRSSTEREKQKDKEYREKEARHLQRTEDKLKEMREKEQFKASALYLKKQASSKTPMNMSSQQNLRSGVNLASKTPVPNSQQPPSRPGALRMNTDQTMQDQNSGDEMPPPPPPKSLLPTGPGHKLREPKKLVKAPSKEAMPKPRQQKIVVDLRPNSQATSRAAPKAAPSTASRAAPTAPAKPVAPAAKFTVLPPKPRPGPSAAQSASRMGRQPAFKASEKSKTLPTQSRADLGAARPPSRMHTVQEANRIKVNVPPVNPAKPPVKRPFQPDPDEPIHRPAKRQSTQAPSDEPIINRPAKRPSQQPKMNPITPGHAQFAQGKIPFAGMPSAQQQQQQRQAPPPPPPNGDDVKLPDIMTDSEDEDSDNDFAAPDWVNTPNLRELLTSQQLVDPEQIFGPIAPLNMEQVFPNKERHKRFRERTSSAYWTNDQLTEEERRKEREARERIVRDGAWTYNPSPLPPRKQ